MLVQQLRNKGVIPRPKVDTGLGLLERRLQRSPHSLEIEDLGRELAHPLFDKVLKQLFDNPRSRVSGHPHAPLLTADPEHLIRLSRKVNGRRCLLSAS